MKRLLVLLLCVLLMFSCKKSAKDINVSEINDACELVDAYLIVIDEMTELEEKYPSIMQMCNDKNIPLSEREKFEMLLNKEGKIINKIRQERWTSEKDVEHCQKFKELEEKMNNLSRIITLEEQAVEISQSDFFNKVRNQEVKTVTFIENKNYAEVELNNSNENLLQITFKKTDVIDIKNKIYEIESQREMCDRVEISYKSYNNDFWNTIEDGKFKGEQKRK